MSNLEKYLKKQLDKAETKVTSVAILIPQYEFVQLHKLNLSDMVRDMLDDMMQDAASKGKKRPKKSS